MKRKLMADFPHPDSSNYFESPTGTKNPDIIGCIARSRNLVIINILKAVENLPTKVEPTPCIHPIIRISRLISTERNDATHAIFTCCDRGF